jgi:hypothetical protein
LIREAGEKLEKKEFKKCHIFKKVEWRESMKNFTIFLKIISLQPKDSISLRRTKKIKVQNETA